MQAQPEPVLEKVLNEIKRAKEEASKAFDSVHSLEELNLLKPRFLGKGGLKNFYAILSKVQEHDKAILGKSINELRDYLTSKINEKEGQLILFANQEKLKLGIDISEPAHVLKVGSFHPITSTRKAIFEVLANLGFSLANGPEIEHDFYNFASLNMPKNHPARDMQDTFYVKEDIMLRTQTSPVQIRAMMAKKTPPLKVMSFGRVYRRDEDISHSPMFHQVEGLYVDEKVSLADLKGTLEALVKGIFSANAKVRMRPSFFPFTEPSVEVDVSCFSCDKMEGCKLCKGSGWIEILGAGMVDPEVFLSVGYDPENYRGFAFGLGIERIAILRYGIPDIRLFFENDIRFLSQF